MTSGFQAPHDLRENGNAPGQEVTAMARPNKGAGHVDPLVGSELSKERLRVILMTFTGELSVLDARRQLGLSDGRFHTLRKLALQAALDGLQPRPMGRPRKGHTADQRRIAALEAELEAAREALQIERVKRELAQAMPGRFGGSDAPEAAQKNS